MEPNCLNGRIDVWAIELVNNWLSNWSLKDCCPIERFGISRSLRAFLNSIQSLLNPHHKPHLLEKLDIVSKNTHRAHFKDSAVSIEVEEGLS